MDAQQREADQRAIVAERKLTDAEFLETMSRTDSLIDHEPDTTCGMCHHQFVMAQVARDMIAAGETEDVIKKWSDESDRRWRSSKFVQLWNEAIAANKDPNAVFEERGWEP
jgi:hypothetical protein